MMLALALLLVPLQAEPQACLVQGERIRGELRWVETQHPNGTPLKNPFVYLVEPRCAEGINRGEGRWVQISPAEGVSLDHIPPGSTVAIEADEYFGPETAWHVGDIVALHARVVGFELQ